MDRKKLVKYILFLMFLIFAGHLLATKFYWYYSIFWFDMVIHFLGGFWVALFFIWFLQLKDTFSPSAKQILLYVFAVAVLWEIFQYFVNNVMGLTPFRPLNTFSDICFGVAGGLAAYFYVSRKKIMLKGTNEIQ